MLVALFLSLVLLSSAQIAIYSERGCHPESLISTHTLESSYLNLCDVGLASILVPEGLSVAVFEQCRTESMMSNPNPNFLQLFPADPVSKCLNFATENGSPIRELSLALVNDMSDVCTEYALHAHLYCKPGECRSECAMALEAADDIADQCSETNVAELAMLRYTQSAHDDESDSDSQPFEISHLCYRRFISDIRAGAEADCSHACLISWLGMFTSMVLICALASLVCARRRRVVAALPTIPTIAVPVKSDPSSDSVTQAIPPCSIQVVASEPSRIVAADYVKAL